MAEEAHIRWRNGARAPRTFISFISSISFLDELPLGLCQLFSLQRALLRSQLARKVTREPRFLAHLVFVLTWPIHGSRPLDSKACGPQGLSWREGSHAEIASVRLIPRPACVVTRAANGAKAGSRRTESAQSGSIQAGEECHIP